MDGKAKQMWGGIGVLGYLDPLSGGLKNAYHEVVEPDEPVEMILSGLSGEALVVTRRRVLLLKAGYAASGRPFGQHTVTVPIAEIQGVEAHVNWGFGIFRLRGPAGELSMHFPRMARDKFRLAVAAIRQMTGEGRETAVTTAPVADDLERLRRLRDLLREGILTEDEFQGKKREILSRI